MRNPCCLDQEALCGRKIEGEEKEKNPSLASKYVGPCTILNSRTNHTYLIRSDEQESWQNERRMKLYTPCDNPLGNAPYLTKPLRWPNMKGAVKRRQPANKEEQILERDQIQEELFPPAVAIPPPTVVVPH